MDTPYGSYSMQLLPFFHACFCTISRRTTQLSSGEDNEPPSFAPFLLFFAKVFMQTQLRYGIISSNLRKGVGSRVTLWLNWFIMGVLLKAKNEQTHQNIMKYI